jgi:putative membrane protein
VEKEMMGYFGTGFNRICGPGGFTGGFGGIGMMIGGFLLLVLFVVLIVALLRRGRHHGMHGMHGMHGGSHGACCGHEGHEGDESVDSALKILNERYAKGEINDEEFTRRKTELKK